MNKEQDWDLSAIYATMREESRKKKQSNLKFSTALLDKVGIDYESKNNDIHLIVCNKDELIDFWPSTGKWIPRGGTANRGVLELIKLIKDKEPNKN